MVRVEHAREDKLRNAGEVDASLPLPDQVLAGQVGRRAGHNHTAQIAQQPGHESAEKAEDALLRPNLPDRRPQSGVDLLPPDELGHHANRNDVEWLRNGNTGRVHHQITFQLLLELLVQQSVFFLRINGSPSIFLALTLRVRVLDDLQVQLVGNLFAEVRTQQVADDLST